jgi:D-aspartate oxidase/D-amino-acid oxidase
LFLLVSKKDKRTVVVTHAYGHGGFGYQSSWGSAEHAVKLVEEGLNNTSKL